MFKRTDNIRIIQIHMLYPDTMDTVEISIPVVLIILQ